VKDPYNENYKTLKKETEDTRRQKDVKCSWVGRINVVNMSILLEVVYRFNSVVMKIPMHFFTEIEKNPKFHMEAQKL
jgi:hypothetical protein